MSSFWMGNKGRRKGKKRYFVHIQRSHCYVPENIEAAREVRHCCAYIDMHSSELFQQLSSPEPDPGAFHKARKDEQAGPGASPLAQAADSCAALQYYASVLHVLFWGLFTQLGKLWQYMP